MINIYDNESGALLGAISQAQLDFLVSQLEEEWAEDHDYYINRPTIEMFAGRGAEPALLDLLRGALGDRDDMEIRWSRR